MKDVYLNKEKVETKLNELIDKCWKNKMDSNEYLHIHHRTERLKDLCKSQYHIQEFEL